MKILVIGNISAGKSTLCNMLKNKLHDYEYVAIDFIRRKSGDGTLDGEKRCKEIFLSTIDNASQQILEISGIGELGIRTMEVLKRNTRILIVYIRCDLETITNRNVNRKWDTPFPQNSENIPIAVDHTNKEFRLGLVEKLLEICPQTLIYSFPNHNISNINDATKIIMHILKVQSND